MITLEKVSTYGWEEAIRGMRNPLNSWDKSDSHYETNIDNDKIFMFGENDFKLAKQLSGAGPSHSKFRRMIIVYVDITAPLYWWKEFDTYKVGTVANSSSTMHTIHKKEFTLDDFSHENIFEYEKIIEYKCKKNNDHKTIRVGLPHNPSSSLNLTIDSLNYLRDEYLETKDKKYWDGMIQLLPSSYNQKRTVMLNYEVLSNIYSTRNNHKLKEWRDFCEWILKLPYNELIVPYSQNPNTKKIIESLEKHVTTNDYFIIETVNAEKNCTVRFYYDKDTQKLVKREEIVKGEVINHESY